MSRFQDWRRERRIKRMSRKVVRLCRLRMYSMARAIDAQRITEVNARSLEQVTRMERRRGLRGSKQA